MEKSRGPLDLRPCHTMPCTTVDFHLIHGNEVHVVYQLAVVVEVGVTKHLRYARWL